MRAAALMALLAASGCGQALVDFSTEGPGGGDFAVETPDLAGADLAGADLAVAQPDGAVAQDLAGVDGPIVTPDLAGADLAGADLAGGDLATASCSAVRVAGGDDRVSAPDQAFQDPTGAITVEAWIYPVMLSSANQVIVAHWNPGGGMQKSYQLRLDSTGHVVFEVMVATTARSAVSTGTVAAGAWTHVAGVFSPDAANASVRAFVNGTGTTTSGFAATVLAGSNNGLAMGNFSDGSAPFDGYLSDVRIEAAALYSANFTPPSTVAADAMTLALYHMNDGTGLVAADSATGTNRPNNASLLNGAAFATPPSCH